MENKCFLTPGYFYIPNNGTDKWYKRFVLLWKQFVVMVPYIIYDKILSNK